MLDAKRHPPRVMCRCLGWNAPKNAALIVAALEAHNSANEPPAVKPSRPSGEVELASAPSSA